MTMPCLSKPINNYNFINYKHKLMQNPQTYINHSLNTSSTKQTFSFSKATRFKQSRNILMDSMYELPSSLTNRSCSFGYGNKVNFVQKERSPPPGSYQPPSDFNQSTITRYNTISFSLGRNKVKFGSFLADSEDKKKNPPPNAYRIKTSLYYSTKGGRMAAKLPTDIDLAGKKVTPGPGTYKLEVTEMKKSGTYILSNFKNNISPKYLSPSSKSRSRSPQTGNRPRIGPGQYQNVSDRLGHSIISKFKNSIQNTFSKQVRPGLEDKSKIKNPGFKYKKFSEFCGEEK